MTSELADKPEKFVQSEEGGLKREDVSEVDQKRAVLTDEQAVAVARLLVSLEDEMERPQDFEWAMEGGECIG